MREDTAFVVSKQAVKRIFAFIGITLFIVGGVFVWEAFSSLLQTNYFRLTRKMTGQGKRVFLCAPVHHHYERKGWKETQVVIRFWIIAVILALIGLSTLKLRWPVPPIIDG